jgi:DNA-directed RNA polymerase specialized sigma24 family protein
MPESLWGKQGATLSHKNACKEFGLAEDEVIQAIKQGRLQYRRNYAHGAHIIDYFASKLKN